MNQISETVAQALQITFDNGRNAPSFTSTNLTELIGNLFIAGVLTALLEEVLYRGYMYGNLRAISNTVTATIVTSLMFAIMHFDIAYIPFLIVSSSILCALREKTGSIIPGVIVHALFNSLIITFTYAGS